MLEGKSPRNGVIEFSTYVLLAQGPSGPELGAFGAGPSGPRLRRACGAGPSGQHRRQAGPSGQPAHVPWNPFGDFFPHPVALPRGIPLETPR